MPEHDNRMEKLAQAEWPNVIVLPLAVAAIWVSTGLSVDAGSPRLGPGFWRMGWLDIVSNIVLYVPLGIGLRRKRFAVCVAWALGLSLAVEISQLFYPDRFTAGSDVAANVAGAVLGWLLFQRWERASAGGLDPFGLNRGVGVFFLAFFAVGFGTLTLEGQPSDFSNWDRECELIVADELTRDRPWNGSIEKLVILDRSLDSDTVKRIAIDGDGGIEDGALFALDPPADLDAIRGVPLLGAEKKRAFTDTLMARREMTLLVWFETSTLDQGGPARIAGFSKSPWAQNFCLGQEGRELVFRLRTPTTSPGGFNPQTKTGDVLSKGERTFVAATYDGRNTRVYVNGRSVARLNLRAHGRLTPFLSDSGLPVTAAFLGAVFALGCLGLGGGAAVRRRWAVSTAAGVTAALLFIAAGGVDAFPDVARLLPVYGIFGGIAAAAACRPGVFWSAG